MWDKQQKKQIAKTARNLWGNGWDKIGSFLQECTVALMIVRTIMIQIDPQFNAMKDLIRGSMQEAGVWEKE